MNYADYRDILQEEFEKRIKINPAYSLRAFANRLEISPSRISEILNKKQGLSSIWAKKIAKKLNFDEQKERYFVLFAESVHGRNPAQKKIATQALSDFRKNFMTSLPLEHYKLLADWHNFTIFEMIKTNKFKNSFTEIAKRIGVSKVVVKESINRLKSLKMIDVKNKKVTVTNHNPFSTISYIPSDVIREHHRQLIFKSLKAIDDQHLKKRELNSLIIALRPQDIEEIKKKINLFFQEINSTYGIPSKELSEVYCLTSQFFDLQVGE